MLDNAKNNLKQCSEALLYFVSGLVCCRDITDEEQLQIISEKTENILKKFPSLLS